MCIYGVPSWTPLGGNMYYGYKKKGARKGRGRKSRGKKSGRVKKIVYFR